MGLGSCTSKTVLATLGIIFFLCAALIWGMSAYVIATYHEYTAFLESRLLLVPAVVAIAVGIVFFFAALLGCCGSENRCTLTLFGVFLFVLLGGMVAGIVVTQTNKADLKSIIEKKANSVLAEYDSFGNSSVDKQIDYIQIHMKCCGMNNASDYETVKAWKSRYPNAVPASCSKTYNSTDLPPIPINNTDLYYGEGCVALVEKVVDGNMQYILGALLGFAILLVLGIVCSVVLCCLKRQEHVPYFSLN